MKKFFSNTLNIVLTISLIAVLACATILAVNLLGGNFRSGSEDGLEELFKEGFLSCARIGIHDFSSVW